MLSTKILVIKILAGLSLCGLAAGLGRYEPWRVNLGRDRQAPLYCGPSSSGAKRCGLDQDGEAVQLISAGLSGVEHGVVLGTLRMAFEAFGVEGLLAERHSYLGARPLALPDVVGLLGRCCVVSGYAHLESDNLASQLSVTVSELLDEAVADGRLTAPLVLEWCWPETTPPSHHWRRVHLVEVLRNFSRRSQLHVPLSDASSCEDDELLQPTCLVALDGAHVSDGRGGTRWDTSHVGVYDGLISQQLRSALLELLKDTPGWDANSGPDPAVWQAGQLTDTPTTTLTRDNDDLRGQGVGLTAAAVERLCAQQPTPQALSEVEELFRRLFPHHNVSRLPTAMFGESVTPLTANAPRAGEQFDFHVDAEPLHTPPGPWTDYFGRFPNRQPGHPQLVTCLLYLNDEWQTTWGASTRFLDPPTRSVVEVDPFPGRLLVMDQDLTHSVTAPTLAAGPRPRYSLVWKLVLHPRPAAPRAWPSMSYPAVEIGSARWRWQPPYSKAPEPSPDSPLEVAFRVGPPPPSGVCGDCRASRSSEHASA